MALNQNHTFEELGDTKCSIVEKNCTAQRVAFLEKLLIQNKFDVTIVKSPPPKLSAKPQPVADIALSSPSSDLPETYTVGVTDLCFNTINAIYNRELKTFEGKIVTPDYWNQSGSVSNDESWYWKK